MTVVEVAPTTGASMVSIDDRTDPEAQDDFNPDRIIACAYWRCGELFEMKTSNQIYCRKACRSRQNKWQRSQDRNAR